MDDINLENKTVLITGANSGIGKATAVGIAETGRHIFCVILSQLDFPQVLLSEVLYEDRMTFFFKNYKKLTKTWSKSMNQCSGLVLHKESHTHTKKSSQE